MAWYWEDIDNPQRAKTAGVNAVRRTGWLWVSLAIAVTFAAIGWGIHRMSRTVAIVGFVWWLVLWFGIRIPIVISGISRSGVRVTHQL